MVYTLTGCLGLWKNEVLAVKKPKSSLSSSRLQYPLLMLLLLVMEGVSTVLTVMKSFTRTTSGADNSLRKC